MDQVRKIPLIERPGSLRSGSQDIGGGGGVLKTGVPFKGGYGDYMFRIRGLRASQNEGVLFWDSQ